MRKIKTEIQEPLKEEVGYPLRPQSFIEYIGQEPIKQNLAVSIRAAKVRNTALDHFLLSGPPGLGKTSLAGVIAREMGVKIKNISAPVIEKTGDMAAILASLEEKDILFIDEIHRLPKQVEEMLYSAMEDRRIDIIIGMGEQAKAVSMQLPPFTLIGATTREGLLSKPLLDRFTNHFRLSYYTLEELADIAAMTAEKLGTPFSKEAAQKIGKAGRGTPRIVNNLTKRVSDYLLALGGELTMGLLRDAFALIGIDAEGLTEIDRRYLFLLSDVFPDKPVGLNTLSASLGESEDTIRDAIEPFLLRRGLILRTPGGRILNNKDKEDEEKE